SSTERGSSRAGCPSTARYGVDVLDGSGDGQVLPGLPTIFGAEDLAVVTSSDVDLFRIALVQADRHDRPVYLHAIEPFPGRAGVVAPIEAAIMAGCGHGQC